MGLSDDLDISCLPLRDTDQLAEQWQALENNADCSFFQSWLWIGTWLQVYNPQVDVLKVSHQGDVIALALIACNQEVRFRFLKSTVAHLHETGNPQEDQLWIEYNGILSDRRFDDSLTAICMNYLIEEYAGWDELVIGAITEQEAAQFDIGNKLTRKDLWQAPTYGVELTALRASSKDYLSCLSRNTRYQIRRSIKHYEKSGTIKLELASTIDQALGYFKEISPLHKLRWGGGQGQSGFANPYFTDFHCHLIRNGFETGNVNLIRVSVAGHAVAYFYNFIYRNRVYFYLSGLEDSGDKILKPGLTGHALCIQHYLDTGKDYYDFMGGGERYKASLAEPSEPLCKISMQKKLFKFDLEHLGRRIKHRFNRFDEDK